MPKRSPSERSYSLEGELVRDFWEYEFDDLEIDGKNLQDFILTNVGEPRRVVPDETIPRSAAYYDYGRVRVTLELLDPTAALDAETRVQAVEQAARHVVDNKAFYDSTLGTHRQSSLLLLLSSINDLKTNLERGRV